MLRTCHKSSAFSFKSRLEPLGFGLNKGMNHSRIDISRWDTKLTHGQRSADAYQSDLAYFRKVCLDRSWCVWGSAEMPCALRVLGPIS